MADPEHIALLKSGVGAWNAWRANNPRKETLRGADLSGADLSGAELGGVRNLTCNQLKNANNWESAYRDVELACGDDIPDPPAF